MADFTIVVMGFDRAGLCAVVEPVYVPEALDMADAGNIAAAGYKAKTGILVQSLYAAAGRVELEKLTQKDVFI